MIKEFITLTKHKKEVEKEYKAKVKQMEEEYSIGKLQTDYRNMINEFKKAIPSILDNLVPTLHVEDKWEADEYVESEEYLKALEGYHNFDVDDDEYYFTIYNDKIIIYHETWLNNYDRFEIVELKKYVIDLDWFELFI